MQITEQTLHSLQSVPLRVQGGLVVAVVVAVVVVVVAVVIVVVVFVSVFAIGDLPNDAAIPVVVVFACPLLVL